MSEHDDLADDLLRAERAERQLAAARRADTDIHAAFADRIAAAEHERDEALAARDRAVEALGLCADAIEWGLVGSHASDVDAAEYDRMWARAEDALSQARAVLPPRVELAVESSLGRGTALRAEVHLGDGKGATVWTPFFGLPEELTELLEDPEYARLARENAIEIAGRMGLCE